ncbi:MAG TPA: ABC transporter ATP-binding protein, partial [Candidatus Eisenbacteria bacterium]|nr:ABC transporter ATP-binding protein [Candidatus Eisenbacteria bacterium]
MKRPFLSRFFRAAGIRPRDFFLLRLFRDAGIRPRDFILTAVLGLTAALLEGLSLGLLIPIINAVLKGDTGYVRGHAVLGKVVALMPRGLADRSLPMVFSLMLLIAAAWILKNLLNYAASTGVSRQVRQFENWLRQRLYERYLSFGMLFYDRNSSGRFYQVMMGYAPLVAQELTGIHHLFYAVCICVIYLSMMTFISWKLTLLVVLVSVVMYRLVRSLLIRIKAASDVHSQSYAVLAQDLSNTLSCIPLVKAYSNENREKEKFSLSSARMAESNFGVDRKKLWIEHLQEIVMILMVLAIGGFVTYFFLKRHAGVGEFMIFFVFTRRLALVSAGMSKVWASIVSAAGPIRAIREVFDDRGKFFVPSGSLRCEGLKERIQFDHLTFSYGDDGPTLRDVTFSAEKGKMTAIVGPSGSGKTTLVHLLMRYYDSPPGTVRIDGRDIREFTTDSLRSGMALVSQEPLLFRDSVRANLVYGLERSVTDAEIEEALEKAALVEFIRSLPRGLETEVGERGARLSVGEAQRLAVARAVLKRAEILIFDEATSALDAANERLIQAAIARAAEGRTTIVIAHRLSTIKAADKVVVIENGAVLEEGGVEELLAK